MQFQQELKYEQPADVVIKAFGDRAYFEDKYRALEASEFEVLEHEADDKRFRIKMKITMPSSAPVPGFAKKFLGENQTIIQEDTWDLAAKTGQLKVEIKGTPIRAEAKMKLEDADGGAVNRLAWTVTCSVPLVGKKVEEIVATDIRNKGANDARATNEVLTKYA